MNEMQPMALWRTAFCFIFTLCSTNLLSVTYRVWDNNLPYNIFGDHVTKQRMMFTFSICTTKMENRWNKRTKTVRYCKCVFHDRICCARSLTGKDLNPEAWCSHISRWNEGVVNRDRCTSQNTRVSFFAAGLIDTPVAEVLTWSV